MRKTERDPSYQAFTDALEGALVQYRAELAETRGARTPEQVRQAKLEDLNDQIAQLIRLERAFVDALTEDPQVGRRFLSAFVREVSTSGKAAAAGRPFFRERAIVYNKWVVPEVKRGAWASVTSFSLNWTFATWVLARAQLLPDTLATLLQAATIPRVPASDQLELPPPLAAGLVGLLAEMARIRDDVVVQNLPLVINRARMFARCTPRAEMGDLDFVDVAVEGVLMALDKVMVECRPHDHWRSHPWHPVPGFAYWRGHSAAKPGTPFRFPEWVFSGFRVDNHHTADKHRGKKVTPEQLRALAEMQRFPGAVFRTTAIGRMGGRLIQSYSQSHLHLGPSDKKLLYHANKRAAGHQTADGVDYEGVADHIRRDRVAWLLARAFKMDPRDVEREVDDLYELAAGTEDPWETLGLLLEERKYEDASILIHKTRGAAGGDDVARVMLASSVVPTVDDEGEDKQQRATPYAAPEECRPDRQLERAEREHQLEDGLRSVPIIGRKLLVLLGLAELRCLEA